MGKQKNKQPAQEESVPVKFSVDSRINNYEFIFMKKKWLAALG